MSQKVYLGIDTSNYTTSLAIVDGNGKVLFNKKQLLPVSTGAVGLRQSDALFAHTKALPAIFREAEHFLRDKELAAVGVSVTPRKREGSYMPCFLAGVSVAEAVSVSANVQLYRFSHQCGHLMAAIASSGANHLLDGQKFLAFHLSGGTTEMLLCSYQKGYFTSEIVGGTADISAGQLIDRIGVEMGLSFPCGREIEQLAKGYCGKLPKAKIAIRDGFVNLSGYQNKICKLYAETGDKAYVSAYTLHVIKEAVKAILQSYSTYAEMSVLYAGGVMSCAYLQKEMKAISNGFFAPPDYSSDNAAGIAWLAKRQSEGE